MLSAGTVRRVSTDEEGDGLLHLRVPGGDPRYPHHVVAETDSAVAFLDRFPTLFGYVLVTTGEHREQVTGDFTEDEYAELQRFIFRVSEGLRRLLAPARTRTAQVSSPRTRPAGRNR